MNFKNVITIALGELKISSRNRVSFALIFIMPIVMVFMMGNVMKSTFNSIENTESFAVLFVNEDKGHVGSSLEGFISTQGSNYFELVHSLDKSIEDEIQSGTYPVGILVDRDGSINVIESGKHLVEESIVKSFVDSYVLGTNLQTALIKFSATINEESGPNIRETLYEINRQYGYDFIREESLKNSLYESLTSFQFFAASMMVFFLLTSGMGIGSSLIDERNNKTYKRINSFPINKKDYLFGKILANGSIGLLQSIVIIIVTRLAFTVNWGVEPVLMALVILLVIFISCALGIIFSNIMSSSGALTAALTVILWFMAFISGGFTATPMLGNFSRLTINYWAFDSITTLMTGGVLRDITTSLIVLATISMVLWGIGLTMYNRRNSHE